MASREKGSTLFPRYKIMRMCWQEDPRDRPTFENLTIELKEMEKQHKVKRKLSTDTIFFLLKGVYLLRTWKTERA